MGAHNCIGRLVRHIRRCLKRLVRDLVDEVRVLFGPLKLDGHVSHGGHPCPTSPAARTLASLEDQIHDGSRAIIRLLGTPQGSAGDTFRLRGLRDIGSRHYARFGACKIRRAAEVFYKQALSGDVQSAQLVSKLIERRCIILGLHTPQTAVVQLVAEVPKATSTDRIEAALNALIKDQRGKGEKPN